MFQYLDATGQRQTIDSADVNAYLRDMTGQDFTAKDIRTWAGTVLVACTLWQFETFESQAQAKNNVIQAIDTVAKQLGNTRAICRKCYVHPTVIAAYFDKSLFEVQLSPTEYNSSASQPGLHPEEVAVLLFLKQRCAQPEILCRKTG